jgi:hypothetical protein
MQIGQLNILHLHQESVRLLCFPCLQFPTKIHTSTQQTTFREDAMMEVHNMLGRNCMGSDKDGKCTVIPTKLLLL